MGKATRIIGSLVLATHFAMVESISLVQMISVESHESTDIFTSHQVAGSPATKVLGLGFLGTLSEKDAPRRLSNCSSLGLIKRTSSALPIFTSTGDQKGLECGVSHRYKFIYVHIPKVGGTHTKRWLRDAHGDAHDYEEIDCSTAMNRCSDYFRWSWVRHPYDRAFSIYAMAKDEHFSKGRMNETSFASWWVDLNRWSMTSLNPIHGRPQAAFLTNRWNGSVVDFLGVLPNASDELSRLLNILHADALIEYQKKNRFGKPEFGNTFGSDTAVHQSPQDMVMADDKLRALLDKEFADDFELFGCQPGSVCECA